ncbi:MAG: hypothetical protein DSY32_02865 [Aquifex sp.]|nr:MAG: hypothetical protein DSY32_02865 [Aquifex sp.]
MRIFTFFILVLFTFSFSSILNADKYEIYLEYGISEQYVQGQKLQESALPPGLIAVYVNKGNRYIVENSVTGESFVVSSNCVIVEGKHRGYTSCPLDPERKEISIWLALERRKGVGVRLFRNTDDFDVNGDGDYNDIVYKGTATYLDYNVYYTAVYDGKTKEIEYEEIKLDSRSLPVTIRSFAVYRVKIIRHRKKKKRSPEPPPPPSPGNTHQPSPEDILKNF